jgi:hypothetical protein
MTHPIIELMVELGSEPGEASTIEPTMTTEEVLQSMFTENTGRHMLDSGGAYGRAWERNQGVDFDTVPETSMELYVREASKYDSNKAEGDLTVDIMVTVNAYHWLRQRVEFDPEMDATFREFADAPEQADDYWLGIMEKFAEQRDSGGYEPSYTVNTYNGEDCLSQTLQYTVWSDSERDECFVALQVHGGADVRGGYTAPRVFTIAEPYSLYDNADYEIGCNGEGIPEHHPGQLGIDGEPVGEQRCYAGWSYRGGYMDYAEVPDLDEFPVERGTEGKIGVLVVDEDTGTLFCPMCKGGKLTAYAPCPSY